MEKVPFSKLPLVAAKVMPVVAQGEYEAFVAPFKGSAHAKELSIRKFKRTVRGGGVGLPVYIVVVRRKTASVSI